MPPGVGICGVFPRRLSHFPAYTKYRTLLRVLESPDVSEEIKKSLREFYKKLDPAQLKRDIEKLQSMLVNMAMRVA